MARRLSQLPPAILPAGVWQDMAHLICGLGNGPLGRGSRHALGLRLVELLAATHGVTWSMYLLLPSTPLFRNHQCITVWCRVLSEISIALTTSERFHSVTGAGTLASVRSSLSSMIRSQVWLRDGVQCI